MLFLTPKKQSRVWDKFPDGSTLIFGDTQITLQHSVVEVEKLKKTAPLVQSFQYNTSLFSVCIFPSFSGSWAAEILFKQNVNNVTTQ